VQAAALRDASAARRAATADRTVEFADKLTAAAQEKRNSGYVRMMTRRWQTGDVYAPHDLSEAEMRKGKRTRRSPDMVDLYGIKPMDMYRNFNFLAFFMTPGGQIQHSNMTQLRPVNQRKVARAIRRAIGLGLMPSVHRHPEILKHEFQMESNHRAFQVMQKTRVYF
jgi:small subunit ribosomal protein S18